MISSKNVLKMFAAIVFAAIGAGAVAGEVPAE